MGEARDQLRGQIDACEAELKTARGVARAGYDTYEASSADATSFADDLTKLKKETANKEKEVADQRARADNAARAAELVGVVVVAVEVGEGKFADAPDQADQAALRAQIEEFGELTAESDPALFRDRLILERRLLRNLAAELRALQDDLATELELLELDVVPTVEGADALIARTDQATMEMQRLDGMMDSLTAELSDAISEMAEAASCVDLAKLEKARLMSLLEEAGRTLELARSVTPDCITEGCTADECNGIIRGPLSEPAPQSCIAPVASPRNVNRRVQFGGHDDSDESKGADLGYIDINDIGGDSEKVARAISVHWDARPGGARQRVPVLPLRPHGLPLDLGHHEDLDRRGLPRHLRRLR